MNRVAPAILLLCAVLIVWEAIIRLFHVPVFALPAPSAIAAVLVDRQAELLEAGLVTAKEIAAGFVLSAIAGIGLALVVARFEAFGRALYPLIVLFQNVPKVALAPIFVLWFGFDLAPKIALIVVIAFFPIVLNMLAGIESTPPGLVALMQSVGAGRSAILRRAKIPHSLPQLMAGLKIAITLSVIGALVGEFSGASAGLGYMIVFASSQLETPLVFAAIAEISVLGVAFYYLVEFAEIWLIPWRPRPESARKA